MQAIFLEDEQKVKGFVEAVSKPRLSKYLNEASGDTKQALLLYHWNSQLSQALYLPLQSWEVALRNKLNTFLSWKYGPRWPFDQRAVRNLTRQDQRRLDDVIQRQKDQRRTSTPSTDHIVADLSAGFWVSQLGKSYSVPYGWMSNLKFRVFVHEPALVREVASEICDDLLDLRNRVAHHEPIFHLALDELRSDLDRMLNAMCPSTASYMASACSFEELWNNIPGRQLLLGQNATSEHQG